MNMLKRMSERREIKRQEFEVGIADWFMLNSTAKKTRWRYAHEVAAADLFGAFYSYMQSWVYEPFILSNRADRGMTIFDKTIYFEMDLCTEGISKLEQKVQNYLKYSRATNERFHVIFSFLGEGKEVERRGGLFIPYLQKLRRGNQFLLANHKAILAQPLGQIFYSPKDEILDLRML